MKRSIKQGLAALYVGAAIFVASMICWIFILGISSCNQTKQAIRKEARNAKKSTKHFNKSDQKSHVTNAALCGERYPPVASTEKEIIPGEPITIHDTTNTVTEVKGDTVFRDRIITKTVRQTDTFRDIKVVVNNAALYASADSNKKLKQNIADLNSQLAVKENNLSIWRTVALWLIGAIACFIILKILKAKTNLVNKIPFI